MAWSVDARIPVGMGGEVGEGDAVLMEGPDGPAGVAVERFEPERGDVAGCACCGGRGAAAVALDRLFQRRVRGEVGFFRRVVAVTTTAEGDMAVWSALRNDPVVSARFRLEAG